MKSCLDVCEENEILKQKLAILDFILIYSWSKKFFCCHFSLKNTDFPSYATFAFSVEIGCLRCSYPRVAFV